MRHVETREVNLGETGRDSLIVIKSGGNPPGEVEIVGGCGMRVNEAFFSQNHTQERGIEKLIPIAERTSRDWGRPHFRNGIELERRAGAVKASAGGKADGVGMPSRHRIRRGWRERDLPAGGGDWKKQAKGEKAEHGEGGSYDNISKDRATMLRPVFASQDKPFQRP